MDTSNYPTIHTEKQRQVIKNFQNQKTEEKIFVAEIL
jgi:hypothetical protein